MIPQTSPNLIFLIFSFSFLSLHKLHIHYFAHISVVTSQTSFLKQVQLQLFTSSAIVFDLQTSLLNCPNLILQYENLKLVFLHDEWMFCENFFFDDVIISATLPHILFSFTTFPSRQNYKCTFLGTTQSYPSHLQPMKRSCFKATGPAFCYFIFWYYVIQFLHMQPQLRPGVEVPYSG